MEALVILFVIILFSFIKLLKSYIKEKQSKHRAIKNGEDYYYNRDGYKTNVKNDVPYKMEVQYEKNGDLGDTVYVQPYTRHVIRNLSQEWRDKRAEERTQWKAEAIKRGDAYYLYDKLKVRGDGLRAIDPHLPVFEGLEKIYIADVNTIWADVNTDERFFVRIIKMSGCVIGCILWSLEEKRYTRILNQDELPTEYLTILRYIIDHSSVDKNIFNNDSSKIKKVFIPTGDLIEREYRFYYSVKSIDSFDYTINSEPNNIERVRQTLSLAKKKFM